MTKSRERLGMLSNNRDEQKVKDSKLGSLTPELTLIATKISSILAIFPQIVKTLNKNSIYKSLSYKCNYLEYKNQEPERIWVR